MQVKCNYCGSFIDEALETCPNCGAPNERIKRAASGVPRTIEELKAFCKEKNVPLDKFHFHIGEDYRGPQAFGIYYDDTAKEYVVYKNKSDGSRAVRYHGHDEGYAVNEIYQKLKEQIGDYKAYRASRGPVHSGPSNNRSRNRRNSSLSGIAPGLSIFIVVLIALIMMSAFSGWKSSGSRRHYSNPGSGYTYDRDYDDYGDYGSYDPGTYDPGSRDDYYDDIDEYNQQTIDSDWDDDSDFSWDWGSDDDSSWWDSSDDSWDWGSDDSWDSGGWDSGGWDSDW